ncbi:hypothetical protein ALTER154_40561 [Alteromonas sp. 154]|nr:hypothetical protein ALTER154_40561 [Alteromonas sp. 154]
MIVVFEKNRIRYVCFIYRRIPNSNKQLLATKLEERVDRRVKVIALIWFCVSSWDMSK